MTVPARTPGKRGKLPAKRLAMGYLHSYLKAPLPAPAYPVDVRAGIADGAWQMLGNGPDPTCTTAPDGVGDCGFAGRQHYRMAKAAFYGETETWETSNELVAEYLAFDGGQDDGVVLADVLLAWYKAGNILAFAPVDYTDPAAVDAAMQAFRGVYCGVNLTDDADELFGEGLPWTVANGEQSDPADGHCIVKVFADVAPEPDAGDGYVTWGAFQKATAAWTQACLTEAWVIISGEDEAAKVDMTALLADIALLDGTGATTPPALEPVPGRRGVIGELASLVHEVAASADRDISEVVSWLRARPVGPRRPPVTRFIVIVKTEPALIVGVVQAVLALLAGTVLTLTAGQTGAVLSVTTAALALVAAIATRPFQVAALTGLVTAVVTLLITFGVPHVQAGTVATLNAAIVAVFALVLRLHVTPLATLHAQAKARPVPGVSPYPVR